MMLEFPSNLCEWLRFLSVPPGGSCRVQDCVVIIWNTV
jgi:hypothetical protein